MTTGNLALDRQLARWYELIPHPVQLDLIQAVDNGVRFPLVPAGRRSGKTERAKRFLVKRANKIAGLYFAAAPTHDQAKKIFWDDLKALSLCAMHKRRPSESDRIIFMPNGSEIHVIGLDKPQRVEGVHWKGGLIDEIADIKADAWEANILPALNTVNPTDPSYRAWCWLLGVPDGLNHYYDLCQKAETGADHNFRVYHWKSAEILPKDVIEDMKRAMSAKQFRQEFEACHLPDTEVLLFFGGTKKICDVHPDDVLVHVAPNGERQPCFVEAVGETGDKTITDVTLETGEVVSASNQHKFKVHHVGCSS